MSKEREALSVEDTLKLALEALKTCTYTSSYSKDFNIEKVDGAILAADKVLAQPAVAEQHKQEPVAWMRKDETCTDCFVWQRTDEHTIPLYTTPPYVPTERQRTWVGLSLQEQAKIMASIPDIPFEGEWHVLLLNAIEAKLKEKNT